MRADSMTVLIGALLIYQFYATILIALSKFVDNEQKLKLIALCWALPFFGAIYARFALNHAEREAARRAQSEKVPTEAQDQR